MGLWCYITGQSPTVYQTLTRTEREQFQAAAVDAKKKGW